MTMIRAAYHGLAAAYYGYALAHIGLAHPDSAYVAIQHAIHADHWQRWLRGEQ